MLDITCSGTPYEIGFTHGSQAKKEVHGSIAFYTTLFRSSARLSWAEAREKASLFAEGLQTTEPRYYEEMCGIAAGAEIPVLDVVALNVRSEITFGLFVQDAAAAPESDGCTSLSLQTATTSLIGQNWDWRQDQAPNLIVCRISQPGSGIPDFAMITEAGIIGKIGVNALGVGCCFNAIRARGMDPTRLPIHLALRVVLESPSRLEAVARLKQRGVAASAHLLIGDETGAVGLECSHRGFQELHPDSLGRICHANHYLAHHPGVEEPPWLADSSVRTLRMRHLAGPEVIQDATFASVRGLFVDEMNAPAAINRQQEGGSTFATLFNAIFDLKGRRGVIKMGRPTGDGEEVFLAFN
ncbi:hypothetical protein ASPZODRAFT_59106 [Penicilliopsis zonata CBS 506.65]|uniref:Peptidase C45 hydrolase domain-containing protein n=1 Tax=Penicilliopsis zonata CBS 506.65 TaxID=1073090 RepID=A0A1L9ST59_9EURO|nr:hypothetical protein ASPZODRAFT_59106 [Penicilliopsis zonata CBS 506.65]OJJ50301.1 hypothetical protein ASPZODRAFT_59106 [Penicilliopsis zonata CBS 506.65]